jgi:hypothetical protein
MPASYWLLFYDVVDDYVERRTPLRAEHLGLARAAHERGELLLAGALADPPDGAVLVFAGDDASVAEDFAAADPYVRNGLVTSWRVRAWTVVVGADDDADTDT